LTQTGLIPIETYLQTWGYLASFIGTFLEGEILLLSAIVASKMGFMNIYWTLIALFGGAYTRDWLIFLVARKKGKQLLNYRPKLKSKFDRVTHYLEKYPIFLLIFARMFYGFTTVIILLYGGSSNISMKKFGLLSALGNLVWLGIYGILAYFFADVMLENISWVSDHKIYVIGLLSLIGLAYWYFVKRREIKTIV